MYDMVSLIPQFEINYGIVNIDAVYLILVSRCTGSSRKSSHSGDSLHSGWQLGDLI